MRNQEINKNIIEIEDNEQNNNNELQEGQTFENFEGNRNSENYFINNYEEEEERNGDLIFQKEEIDFVDS